MQSLVEKAKVLIEALPQCHIDMHLVALASLGNLVPVADAPDANHRLLAAVGELQQQFGRELRQIM